MESKNVRTRIAPSPTGDLHIGHLRTLLYDYALAKKYGGSFVIRIEDTDRTRFVEGSMERTLDTIKDYGLDWDEGPRVGGKYGPYIQSDRLEDYKEHAQKLIEKGHAYYCFCTKERLDSVRDTQQKKGVPPMYDGHCRDLSKDEVENLLKEKMPYVIRLKVPRDEKIYFNDLVYGEMEFDSNLIDDQVLIKSDGFPTYHLAVVVDDHKMDITHILRGNDWLPSAPKHVLLYRFFEWDMPLHAHLPNLKEMGSSKKLSKRHGSVAAADFLREGYIAEAVLNFIMFLGWNPGGEKEVYSLEEFVEAFSIKDIHKTDLVAFDRQKLLWMNGTYLRNLSVEELWIKILDWSSKYNVDLVAKNISKDHMLKIVSLIQERIKLLSEVNGLTRYFFERPEVDKDLLTKWAKEKDRTREILQNFIEEYMTFDNWRVEDLDKFSHKIIENYGYKPKEAFMTLRVAITGESATPPLFDVMEVLGKEEVNKRLEKALELL